MPFFTKYFLPSDHSSFPKFIFYSGHAEVLGPLFLAFGTDISTNRAPGSAIFLEIYEETNLLLQSNTFVSLTYKPTASMDDSDTYYFRLTGDSAAMPIDEFRQFVDGKIAGWNEKFAGDDVSHCLQGYDGGDDLGFGAD
jgi:hypothetical protein